MTVELDIPDQPGVIAVEKLREMRAGMNEAEVTEALGPPLIKQCSNECAGPTETFRRLGFTILDFEADRDIDSVWVYAHNRRGKFKLTKYITTYIGFRDGVATGSWQHVQDQVG